MSARVFFCKVQKKGLTRSKQELANPKFQSQAVRRFVKTMGRSAVAGQSAYISFVKYKKKAYQTDGQSRSASWFNYSAAKSDVIFFCKVQKKPLTRRTTKVQSQDSTVQWTNKSHEIRCDFLL
jgi:hypothetical protein